MDTKNQLIRQIKVVLDQLENKYYDEIKSGVLQLIYKRYTSALEVLENNKNINEINIIGSVRAYLDSYSDYENPLLEDLYHAEKLYQKLLEDA
ncbi:hypothetical protein P9232_15680 [Weizmannia sp. CD-2023]|uniref:hypothetical protein n=1 Tax=Heyndrickxia TaxID=2837504 RepID=UPI000556AD24|nr:MULTISPECIES: hypothetical protein [Heyndrickxia]KGT37239.1 hypothetical protein P421_16490 [Heyndrickxia coagulans P38]MED4322870.1 hypothetical protein [Weizmannia sp. CD-2023]MED4841872.1 hypothetical protein [Weizmannia sp. CD-2023]MED4901010.1 hypothetical protein [Weizmannia sp. CD-2023]MED4978012.1 hypothetical protein [Weizmannia sp. CD-2023]